MKKKVKDVTIGELTSYCKRRKGHCRKDGTLCPFFLFCYQTMFNGMYSDHILEQEIKLEDEE